MLETTELLNIKQASQWATEHIGKTVTPSNIVYLINYGRILKEGIANVLNNCKKFLTEDFDIFLFANDKYNLYPHLN